MEYPRPKGEGGGRYMRLCACVRGGIAVSTVRVRGVSGIRITRLRVVQVAKSRRVGAEVHVDKPANQPARRLPPA